MKKSALALAIATCVPVVGVTQESEQELPTAKAKAESEKSYKVDRSSMRQLTQPLVDTPRTITTVSSAMISDQGITSLNDALRNVAGVSTFAGGEGGGVNTTADVVTVRGFDTGNSIFVDGLRDIAGYSRDLFNYEQVEVSKGADGSIFGRSTGGGALNLLTKRAKFDDFGTAEAAYDGFDTVRFSVDANRQLSENIAGRLNVLYTDGGDTFDNGVENYETQALAASIKFKLSEKTDLTVDAMIQEQDNVPILGLPFIRADAAGPFVEGEPFTVGSGEGQQTVTNPAEYSVTDSFGTGGTGLPEGLLPDSLWSNYYGVLDRDFEEVSVNMLTLSINHQVNDAFKLRAQTRYATNERQTTVGRPVLLNTYEGTSPARGSGITAVNYSTAEVALNRLQALDDEFSLFNSQIDGLWNISSDKISQDIVFGLEYAVETRDSYFLDQFGASFARTGAPLINYQVDGGAVTNFPTVSLFDPSQDITFDTRLTRLPDNRAEETEATTTAIYAFDTIKFGSHWQIDLNGRFENYNLEGSRCAGSRGACGADDVERGLEVDENFFSYGGAVSYKPTDTGSIYLGYANSQQPPGINLDIQAAEDNQLDSQEAESIEIGTKWELLDQKVLLSAAIFNTTKTVADENAEGNPALAGEQESSGFELGLTGKISERFSVNFNYTNLDTEITATADEDDVGDGLQAAPEDTANLWVNVSLLDDTLSLGGGATHSSGNVFWRQSRIFFDTGSFTEYWLMAQYKVSDKLNVQLNANNITDEQYATDYSAWGHARPNDPRNVRLAVRYMF
jgi:catecholate siderophore receptor